MNASRTIMSRLSPCLVDLRFGVAPIPRIRSELDVAAGKLPVELDLGSADMMGGMVRAGSRERMACCCISAALMPMNVSREWLSKVGRPPNSCVCFFFSEGVGMLLPSP